MRIDLARSLRRVRPERFRGGLTRRTDTELAFATGLPPLGTGLLLDTTVYVDQLEGKFPPAVNALLRRRPVYHLDLVLGELAHNFGRLDPDHPGTAAVWRELRSVIDRVPARRVQTPSPGVVLEAGILAGLLFRLGNLQPGRETAALVDATLYLHAVERGHTVPTRNIRDFDFLDQLVPSGRVAFYRQEV